MESPIKIILDCREKTLYDACEKQKLLNDIDNPDLNPIYYCEFVSKCEKFDIPISKFKSYNSETNISETIKAVNEVQKIIYNYNKHAKTTAKDYISAIIYETKNFMISPKIGEGSTNIIENLQKFLKKYTIDILKDIGKKFDTMSENDKIINIKETVNKLLIELHEIMYPGVDEKVINDYKLIISNFIQGINKAGDPFVTNANINDVWERTLQTFNNTVARRTKNLKTGTSTKPDLELVQLQKDTYAQINDIINKDIFNKIQILGIDKLDYNDEKLMFNNKPLLEILEFAQKLKTITDKTDCSKYGTDIKYINQMDRIKDCRSSATKMVLMLLVTGQEIKHEMVKETMVLNETLYESTNIILK